MRYYPAFLDLARRRCLVVGGGAVAERKVRALLACGAKVVVVSPVVVRPLAELARQGRVEWRRRRFQRGDVRRAFLAVAATDDEAANQAVWREAKRWHHLVNVVDRPALCSFIVPSVFSRGDLAIAVSARGVSPALSRWIRQDMGARYGPWAGRVLERMGRWRRMVHREFRSPTLRKRRLQELLRRELKQAGMRL